MEQDAGYIGIQRRFFRHFLWKEKRVYSRAEAWLDLLAEAWYGDRPGEVIPCGRVMSVSRGEILRSLDEWAQRWRWNKSAVNRFFVLLENEQMIVCVNECRTTRVLIINYDLYNPPEKMPSKNRHENETDTKQESKRLNSGKSGNCSNRRNAEETKAETLVKRSRNGHETPIEEEGKNKNNNPCSPLPGTVVSVTVKKRKLPKLAAIPDGLKSRTFYRSWIDWQKERRNNKRPITVKAAKGQLAKLAGYDADTAAAMLQQSIDNGWTGIFELKPGAARRRSGQARGTAAAGKSKLESELGTLF